MKKNNFTRFLFSFLFIIGILGCSNSVFNNSFQNSKSNEKVIIKIGFYDEVNNLQRTAMPSNSKKYFVDFTDIELYGKQKLGTSYGSEIIIAKWKDYNALLSDDFTTDATEKLKNGNTYGFRLIAKRYGVIFESSIDFELKETNNISFNLEVKNQDEEIGERTGCFDIDIKLSSFDDVSKLEVIFGKYGDIEENFETIEFPNKDEESDYSYTIKNSIINITKKNIEPGNYLLTLKGKKQDDEVIYNNTSSLIIKAGFTSYDLFDLSMFFPYEREERNSVKITYKVNDESLEFADVEQDFLPGYYTYSANKIGFINPGYVLRYWSTSANDNEDANTYSEYELNDFTEDTTLYAIWRDENTRSITYHINDDWTNKVERKDYNKSTSVNLTNHPLSDIEVSGKQIFAWKSENNGEVKYYKPDETIDMNSLNKDIELYAIWIEYDSENDCWLIEDESDWNLFFSSRNETDSTILENFMLKEDIELTTSSIQTKDFILSSSFNANNKFIKGLKSTVFTEISSTGKVENLLISTGTFNNAVITLINNGTIENCKVTNVKVSSTEEEIDVGIIASVNNGTITKCEVTGTVSGVANVGGVVGINEAYVTYCNSGANVDGTGTNSRVGGLVGYNHSGYVEYSMAWGKITATKSVESTFVGGLIGRSYASSNKTNNVRYCAASCELIGGEYQGGLIGGSIRTRAYRCYSAPTKIGYYYIDIGKFVATGGLYGYEDGGNSNTGWEDSYVSSENSDDVNKYFVAGSTSRDGSIKSYRVSSISSVISELSDTDYIWKYDVEKLNGLPYKIIWKEN